MAERTGAVVREARWTDLPALASLEAEVFPDDAWSERSWWAELAGRPRREYVVAVAADGSGAVLGYGGLDHGGDVSDVMTVVVAPGARGTGTGRRLLDELEARAAARGAAHVMLEVRADNEAALRALRGGRVPGAEPAPRVLPARRGRRPGHAEGRCPTAVDERSRPVADEPLVLGIETSCDETGVGLVRGGTLLFDAVASSVDEHARFGGVVPEVASRAHLEAMVPTIERACREAGVALRDVDAVAVTSGPGLAGALMVGRRLGQGPGARPRGAAARGQPPREPRRRRRGRARAAARAHPRPARLGRALLAAARPRRHLRRPQPRLDHRRRRRGGLRQGGPRARTALPGRPAHRPRRA